MNRGPIVLTIDEAEWLLDQIPPPDADEDPMTTNMRIKLQTLLSELRKGAEAFYRQYALPLIANHPDQFDLDGFHSISNADQTEHFSSFDDAYDHFEQDANAQYELHPRFGRYATDQWYQKWNVVFSLEHMWNWLPSDTDISESDDIGDSTNMTPTLRVADLERRFTTTNIKPWLDHITLRHRIHSDHRLLLEKVCSYLVKWHQKNRPLALVGACRLNPLPLFPPAWFVDKQQQNHGAYEGITPSYIARFVPPYRLTRTAVPERWDEVFLKGLTVQYDIDPGMIAMGTSTIPIYGLTMHYDEKRGYSQIMMVMKKATYGNLETRLEEETPTNYSKLRTLALSITKSLKDLHWEYIHGNVHPRNILLNYADYVGELVDITFMQRNQTSTHWPHHCAGGRWPYVAPETVAGQTLTTAADIYALGIILWQLVSRVTFPDDTLVDPFVYRVEPIPGVMTEWEDLYTDCLNTDPTRRPNAYTVYRRLENLPADIPLNIATCEYIQQRRAEIQTFLAEHRQQPNESMLARVGDQILTASVTRLVNRGLEKYPRLVQRFAF
ncbi:hypothetical protein EC973_002216 [Apophysomyces ossiformis]|uniref:Protein kinase domain-containing protein n=1 Tax=Apophysomyces ossiformis TaxID=679940 RepID=A0A8H7ET64_9FUNG|nr:hypothetical protein EC973_002216 [Apophysomyces ossiformis]